jgi:hypothetical protein
MSISNILKKYYSKIKIISIINRSYEENDSSLMSKNRNACNLILKMNSLRSKDRPNCDKILEEKCLWALGKEEFNFDEELKMISSNDELFQSSYLMSLLNSIKRRVTSGWRCLFQAKSFE